MMIFQELALVFFLILLIGAVFFKLVYSNAEYSLEDFDYNYEKYKDAVEKAKILNILSTFAIIVLAIVVLIILFFIYINKKFEYEEEKKTEKDEKKIACTKCGGIFSMEYLFCPKCGNKMNQIKFCEKCGCKNNVDSMYCKQCGNKLKL